VEDLEIGIAPYFSPTCFDSVPSGTVPLQVHGGLGVGLAISSCIGRLHGGASRLNGGSWSRLPPSYYFGSSGETNVVMEVLWIKNPFLAGSGCLDCGDFTRHYDPATNALSMRRYCYNSASARRVFAARFTAHDLYHYFLHWHA